MKKVVNVILVLVVLVVIFFLATEGQMSLDAFKSDSTKAHEAVESYLYKTLNDWESYEAVEWGAIESTKNNEESDQKIMLTFRAKNKLGAYVLSKWVFYFDRDYNIIAGYPAE